MGMDSEKIAASFFELSSEQRIQILYTIKEKPLTLSKLTESLGASKSEVHRNITRMIKSGLIQKDSELHFHLTLYGKTICEQISSLFFVPNNIQFFSNHTFGRILKLFKMTIINARYNRFFIFILVSSIMIVSFSKSSFSQFTPSIG